jgi:hypothetical protein
MPDLMIAIYAALAVFVFGCVAFYLVENWNEVEDDDDDSR